MTCETREDVTAVASKVSLAEDLIPELVQELAPDALWQRVQPLLPQDCAECG